MHAFTGTCGTCTPLHVHTRIIDAAPLRHVHALKSRPYVVTTLRPHTAVRLRHLDCAEAVRLLTAVRLRQPRQTEPYGSALRSRRCGTPPPPASASEMFGRGAGRGNVNAAGTRDSSTWDPSLVPTRTGARPSLSQGQRPVPLSHKDRGCVAHSRPSREQGPRGGDGRLYRIGSPCLENKDSEGLGGTRRDSEGLGGHCKEIRNCQGG